MRIIFAAFLLAVAAQGAAAQTILKEEPKPGALKHGSVVQVDDGSCPAGQIKEVSGGRDDGPNKTKRSRRCVAKK